MTDIDKLLLPVLVKAVEFQREKVDILDKMVYKNPSLWLEVWKEENIMLAEGEDMLAKYKYELQN